MSETLEKKYLNEEDVTNFHIYVMKPAGYVCSYIQTFHVFLFVFFKPDLFLKPFGQLLFVLFV